MIHVKYSTDQVLDEFLTVLNLGGTILDDTVEHEIYGQIRADLLIETPQDTHDFVDRLSRCRDNPLKVLTDDCYYHTITAPAEKLLDLIEDSLRVEDMLLE